MDVKVNAKDVGNCPVLTLLENIQVSQTVTQQMYRQGMVSGDHALWGSLESNGENRGQIQERAGLLR